MNIHKLVLLISVLILPTPALLAANARDLAQPAANKSPVVLPAQPATQTQATTPSQTVVNPKVTAPTLDIKVPQNSPLTEKPIHLANNKQLYLTNGQSIVRSGVRGLNVIGVNGTVQTTYNNAILYEGVNREVWINANGAKTKIGMFARIQTSNIIASPAMEVGNVTQANSDEGSVGRKPINMRPKAQVLTQGTDGGQEATPPGTSFGLGDDLGLEATDLVADPGPPTLAPVSLSVTTDSVVATAIVTVNPEQRKFKLHWGDDQVENINLLTPSRSLGTGNGEAKDVDGGIQYTFQHVYQAPGGRKIIIAVSTDAEGEKSNTTKAVEIVARYKLSFYPISLRFPDHLDAFFESYSEMRVDLNVLDGRRNLLFHKKWEKSILTNPTTNYGGESIRWRLDGSNFSREVSVTDEPITIYLVLREQDGLGEDGSALNTVSDIVTAPFRALQYIKEKVDVEFEPFVTDRSLHIHPNDSTASGDKSRSYIRTSAHEIGNEEGSVYSTFSYDFKLIVPVDTETPVFIMD
ncbi:hypothetical protein MNBD_GAMMA26-1872 [hydrothermal vent metagenome]|uniref:Uncharacterized protein n=1 Tax=hydrothermal vent metagenome TaxID=652676 RepID=A0A3B1BFY1_9ZZZZ